MPPVFRWEEFMHTISSDIETFSSNDLSKCGVYKYVQAPDFDIILFGYSVDGGVVKVVDLAAGEEIVKRSELHRRLKKASLRQNTVWQIKEIK